LNLETICGKVRWSRTIDQ